ncbi:MAG: ABC transporter substrate-binding protein [Chloroflexia bacterium]|nr:ABC transporter substrate-binding protein [Chloroflexia bacterium]
MSHAPNAGNEAPRELVLRRLMATTGSRRDMLKAAAAAGMIPVLTSGQVAARAAAQEDQPVRGGTFVTIGHHDVSTLSPDNDGETVIWAVVIQMHDGLYMVNDQYELEPVLAESYEPSADGRSYTFKLREGVTFHNGDPFTSADVKYTYDWIKDPANASTRGASMELVESVETPDDYTVVVNLTAADATFMVNTATTYIYPAAYHAEVGEDAYSGAPMGTGAFKLDGGEWVPAQRTVLVANEDYFRGRPNFDQFQIDIVPEANGRWAALDTGTADNSIWTLNAEDNTQIEESGNFTVYLTLNNAVNHFVLNNEHPALSDVNVRKALLHATDRQAFIDDVYLGQAVLATSNLSPNVEAFYNPEVQTYDYDVDGANALLEEAGWVAGDDGIREKDGTRLAFTLAVIQGDTQRRPEAEVAQQWYQDIGVEMELLEVTDAVAGMIEGKYDAALFNWVYGGGNGEPDARDTLKSDGSNNFSHFKNEELDTLLDEGVVELDPAARVEIYNRIQEIVAENVPFLYFLHPQGYSFWANSVQGLPETVLSSDNLYQNVYKLWKVE